MNDQRVAHARVVLRALVESLDATARISRWDAGETAPEPLLQHAAKLGDRLGAANRFAAAKVAGGTPAVVASLDVLSGAIRRLDAAYVQYCHRIVDPKPGERDEAAVALDAEIAIVQEAIGRATP